MAKVAFSSSRGFRDRVFASAERDRQTVNLLEYSWSSRWCAVALVERRRRLEEIEGSHSRKISLIQNVNRDIYFYYRDICIIWMSLYIT